jgi:tetratricopeptide (TPR) repeat protein
MKRAIIASVLFIGLSAVYGQEIATPTLNFNVLEKKLKKSDEAIKDEKDKTKAKTWFERGELFQDIHDVNIEFLRLGMPESEAKLYLQEPKEVKTSEVDGKVVKEDVYDRITLVFENDVLKDWKETKVIDPDPLPKALDAYKETLNLDDKGKLDKKVKENLDRLKKQAENDAIRYFTAKDYKKALENFELIQNVSKTRVYNGYVDSVIVYNAALAARNAGDHATAAKYFEKAASIKYGGSDTYYLLKSEYIALKDSAKALDALKRGYENYPDSTLIIFELVNYYLSTGNNEEGMKYLNIAEHLAGDNPSIYFAKGTLFEKLGDKEKAMEAYRQAIEVDPEFYNAWFNIGALYFNNAVEMYDKANKIEDLKEYNKAKEAADEVLKKAIEPLEKAHQINPKDQSCLETLSTIYYRLQMMDKREQVLEELKKLKAGG